jgi:spore coat polysaccharide biosynthesis protein SpsF
MSSSLQETSTADLRVVAIIQARLNSNRLPGKILLDIAGQPMLCRVVERTRLARAIHEVVVATTSDASDDVVVDLCVQRGYSWFRRSQFDVLDRYYQTARQFQARVIVRITADCPLIDPQVVDLTVTALLEFMREHPLSEKMSFAANRLPPPWGRTYPVGLDTEVCTFDGLQLAWQEASLPHQREHVMPFFYDNPQRFNIIHLNYNRDLGYLRWTVDTAEDLVLVRQIYSYFPGRDDFSWQEVLELVERVPSLSKINARIQPKHYLQVDERNQSGS